MNFKRAAVVAAVSFATAGMAAAQGAGMMGGYGYGMGPGMMGGYGPGAYGMGPGTMGGYGPGGYGMGPGMMWGYGSGAYAGLNLSEDQRKKIDEIQEQAANAMWQLMGTMHQQGYHLHGKFGPGATDEQAARKAYESMAATQRAMFELQLDVRKKIEAVLTPEQREQLRRSWSGG